MAAPAAAATRHPSADAGADAASLPLPLSSTPPAATTALASKNTPAKSAPQPNQLLSVSKIQRIAVWCTEVSASEIECVCSMRGAPALPTAATSRAPTVHSLVPFASTVSGRSHAPDSPASSLCSSSDVYTSTRATSRLSSTSLGAPLDGKQHLCPQCGLRKIDNALFWLDSQISLVRDDLSTQDRGSGRHTPAVGKKHKLWLGFKKLARKCTNPKAKHVETQNPHQGRPSPHAVAAAVPPPQPEANTPSHQCHPAGQSFRKVSSTPTCDAPGTQMYSSLRYAADDDERLVQILGAAKVAAASPNPKPDDENAALPAVNDQPDGGYRETEGARRLRERAERLEKGRRLLARSGSNGAQKRPASFAGIGGIAIKL